MEIWAHRGGYVGFNEIENTLQAFYKAVHHERIDGIELDIRLCKSGEPIVFHDPTLWRLSDAFLMVESLTLRELRKSCNFYIPTLEEVLEEFKGKTKFLLDLKPNKIRSLSLEREVWNLIKYFPITDIKISSASPIVLAKMLAITHGRCPELCLVIDHWLSGYIAPHLLYTNAVHINEKLTGWGLFKKSKLLKWKNRALKVRVWTVNNGFSAQQYALQGADGIITDDITALYAKVRK
jgi:glycerophosphoryl diester phosphodiesterase